MAQNEVERERNSLKGINAVGFTVNVQSELSLTKKDKIQTKTLQELGLKILRDGGIPIIPDNEVKQSDEIPFLHLHVNTMDAGRGLVPFALTLYLYQPVKLTLNRDLQTSAITWESGSVGIVSYDKMALIEEGAQDLINEFIADYNQINSPN